MDHWLRWMSLCVIGSLTASGARAANKLTDAPVCHAPTVFAPGVVSGPQSEADATFSADGKTVFFARGGAIMVSHRRDGAWSMPAVAPFSEGGRDLEPVMAPDGSYLIFVSSRPDPVTHRKPDGFWGGKTHPGKGGNLWRVDRTSAGWSKPVWLPATINRSGSIFGPAIAANGNLYFSDVHGESKHTHIFVAKFRHGVYSAPQPMPFTDARWGDVDPAVAPDESFIVFASSRPPTRGNGLGAFIAFAANGQWSKPIDVSQAVGHISGVDELRLAPDGHTLYFASDQVVPVNAVAAGTQTWNNGSNNIWKVDLAPWLVGRGVSACRNQKTFTR